MSFSWRPSICRIPSEVIEGSTTYGLVALKASKSCRNQLNCRHNFKLFPSFSLQYTMTEEALTYNLVFVL